MYDRQGKFERFTCNLMSLCSVVIVAFFAAAIHNDFYCNIMEFEYEDDSIVAIGLRSDKKLS